MNRRQTRMLLLLWMPALLAMGAISRLSAQSYESQSIRPWLDDALGGTWLGEWLAFVSISYGRLSIDGGTDGPGAVAEFALRKAAHFAEYALLAGCLLLAVRHTSRRSWTASAWTAGAFAAAFAASDEFHQMFVAGRTPMMLDVAVDIAGAMAGIALYGRCRGRLERAGLPDGLQMRRRAYEMD